MQHTTQSANPENKQQYKQQDLCYKRIHTRLKYPCDDITILDLIDGCPPNLSRGPVMFVGNGDPETPRMTYQALY